MLVDRIWPRGLTNEHAGVEVWPKDIPSAGLRTGFDQSPCTRTFHMLIANHTGLGRMPTRY